MARKKFSLAICHPFLEVKGGAEKCMLRIAEKFDATIYCIHYDKERTFPELGNIDVRPLKKDKPVWGKLLPKRLYEGFSSGMAFYNLKIPRNEYDVLGLSSSPSEWARNNNMPAVWYCHSPAREVYDLYDWRMGGRSIAQKAAFAISAQVFRNVEANIVPKIEHIFANSIAVQGRIRKYLHRESEVLYSGVQFEKYKSGKFEPYFFYSSRIAPEKRYEIAIRAFLRFREKHKNWKFIIAGSLLREKKEHVKYYEEIKKLLGSAGEIRLDIEDKEIYELYANCTATLYTPLNEDFGLIPVESAASLKPCIAINEGGPKETILDGKTGFLIETESEMAERMAQLADNLELAKKMGKAGKEFCYKRFNWDLYMERYGKACERVIDARE